jgi:glycosyltransferase involved in cell wall biosynthesis
MSGAGSRKVTILTYELRGLTPVGGMGTATTHLALALARAGHSVDILLGWQDASLLDSYWRGVYEGAGVEVRSAPPSGEKVDSWHFGVMRNVELALRADPPDVVVAHDFYAPAYSALRLRQAGLAFSDCLFVVFCHGTRRYVADTSRQLYVKDLRTLLSVGMLERASVELADAVVSPSAYLVDWMRGEGWRLPEQTHVIPYVTRSGAEGGQHPRAHLADRVERLAFFGRLDEKKGLREFAAGLNALEPELLGRVELELLGKPTATWPVERVAALFSEQTTRALRALTFETDLDQHEALARLKRPGTVAVMPSLLDNSPNTVYECLELGVPFLASDVGGVHELIAPADRERVLFEPTASGVEAALRRVLAGGARPAAPSFDAATSIRRWTEVLRLPPSARRPAGTSEEPFALLIDDADVPDDDLVPTLERAQAASGADVVTCAVRLPDGVRFFAGDPGGLGVLGNDYGTVALIRRSLLDEPTGARPSEHDPRWPLLAGLAAAGAEIVSIPVPLVTSQRRPGTIEEHPADALLAVKELERSLPPAAAGLARLAAGLAATTSARTHGRRPAPSRWRRRARSFARRALSARPASPR